MTSHIQVYCRVRPGQEEDLGNQELGPYISTSSSNFDEETSIKNGKKGSPQLIINGKTSFHLDNLFINKSQEEIFDETFKPLLTDLFNGYNCTLFTYGQTGSGKTHTLIGGSIQEERGLLPRAVETIFQRINEYMETDQIQTTIKLSFIEIYHEKLKDLLNLEPVNTFGGNVINLAIREQKDGTIWVENLKEIPITNASEFNKHLQGALKRRVIGEHKLNERSSRSHLVCMLSFTILNPTSHLEYHSKLSMIDLAGSEMAKKTDASGKRLVEAKFINKSLSALSKVISALAHNTSTLSQTILSSTSMDQTNSAIDNNNMTSSTSTPVNPSNLIHIPYRDSKLTRLLQSSLSGKSKTIILLTISSLRQYYQETISTLKFGERARLIHISPYANKNQLLDKEDKNNLKFIQELQEKIIALEYTIAQMNDKANAIERHISPAKLLSEVIEEADKLPQQHICEICNRFIENNIRQEELEKEHEIDLLKQRQEEEEDLMKYEAEEKHEKDSMKKKTLSTKKRRKSIKKKINFHSEKSSKIREKKHPDEEESSDPEYIPLERDESDENILDFDQKEEDESHLEGNRDEEEDEEEEEEDLSDRCAICGLNTEEAEALKNDTGEELGFLFNCDGNCGKKFHIRCVGFVGSGGQFILPDGEWFCTDCTANLDSLDNSLVNSTESLSHIHSKHPPASDNEDENNENNIDHDDNDEHLDLINNDDKEMIHSTPNKSMPIIPQDETKLITTIHKIHEKYESMRKERNRILLHWQNEKKMQKQIDHLRKQKQRKIDLKFTSLHQQIQDLTLQLQQVQHENNHLKKTIDGNPQGQGVNPLAIPLTTGSLDQFNFGHQLMMSLANNFDLKEFLFPEVKASNNNSTKEKLVDAILKDNNHLKHSEGELTITDKSDESINEKEIKSGIPKTWLKSKSLNKFESSSKENIVSNENQDNDQKHSDHMGERRKSFQLPSYALPIADSPVGLTSNSPWNIQDDSHLLNDNSQDEDRANKANKQTDFTQLMDSFSLDNDNSKEPSRFVNPLKNRLSDLLAMVQEEAQSYAELRKSLTK